MTDTTAANKVTLIERLAHSATARPDAVAVVTGERGELHLSVASIDLWSNQLAHHLRRFGVRREVAVGIWLAPTIEQWIAILGVLKAGGTCLFLDAETNARRERLEEVGMRLLISRTGMAHHETIEQFTTLWETVWLDLHWAAIAAWSSADPLPFPSPSQVACRLLEPDLEILHGDLAQQIDGRVPFAEIWPPPLIARDLLGQDHLRRRCEAWHAPFWRPLTLGRTVTILSDLENGDEEHLLEEQRIDRPALPDSIKRKVRKHQTADERAERFRLGKARQRQRLAKRQL